MAARHQYSPLVARIAGFTGWPLISLVVPLLVTPVVSRIAGHGWSSVVTAMSIGTFGSALVTWGWSYVGPGRVAAADNDARHTEYSLSLWTRSLLAVIVLPAAALLSYLVSVPALRVDSIMISVAFALGGLSPQWYCIGIGKATLLGLYDTLPRAVATVLSLPLVLMTNRVWPYPSMIILATIASLVAFQKRFRNSGARPDMSLRRSVSEIWSTAAAALASLVGSAYSYAPVPIATAFLLPEVSSSFASADQLYRYLLFSVVTLGNALQGWVLEIPDESGLRRQKAAIILHMMLGVGGGVFLSLFGRWLSGVFFGEAVASDITTSVWYGLSFFCISASTPFLRNVLIPSGRAKLVLVFSSISACVGLLAMALSAIHGNASGIAAGLALSEFALACGAALAGTLALVRRAQA